GISISCIRAAVAQRASKRSASKQAPGERKYSFGLLPSPPGKPMAAKLSIALGDDITEADLPPKVLLTEFLAPVGDQGNLGSCVGWSFGYYAFTYAVAQRLGIDPTEVQKPEHQFSPAFIYGMG